MKFNIFKSKEKEVIDANSTPKTNDIVDDFGLYTEKKANSGKAIIERPSDVDISSFESSFTENISTTSSNTLYNDEQYYDRNNFEIPSDESISNNISIPDTSPQEQILSYETQNINQFNPYLNNNIGTYDEIRENKDDEQASNVIQNDNTNYSVNQLDEITNNITKIEDVNIALSNIYNKDKQESIKYDYNINEQKDLTRETYSEQNYSSNLSQIPVYDKPYLDSDVDPGYKRCPKCGQKIREDYKQCFVCGTML